MTSRFGMYRLPAAYAWITRLVRGTYKHSCPLINTTNKKPV